MYVESQPVHKKTQDYRVIDAALGVVERGTWNVHDAVDEQPWLPNGPIPLNVDVDAARLRARRACPARRATSGRDMTTAVVVGSGPNGLAAAIRLAQEGARRHGARGRTTGPAAAPAPPS